MATIQELNASLDSAEAAARANSDAEDSAENLIVSLAQALRDALAGGGTPPEVIARVTALSDSMNARAAKLAAAVVAGTPAQP